MSRANFGAILIAPLAAFLVGCPAGTKAPPPPPAIEKIGAAEPAKKPKLPAAEFVAQVNHDLIDLNREVNAAGWSQLTNITVDSNYLAARATERMLEFYSRKAGEARAYADDSPDPATARALKLIRLGVSAPGPRPPRVIGRGWLERSSASAPKQRALTPSCLIAVVTSTTAG